MSEHVNVNREGQVGSFARPLDHPSNSHASEGLVSLVQEDVTSFRALTRLQTLQRDDLISLKIMRAVIATLHTADNDRASAKVDVIPAQITGFANPEPMTIDHQPDEPIPVSMPVPLEGREQFGHLILGEVLANPIGLVGFSA